MKKEEKDNMLGNKLNGICIFPTGIGLKCSGDASAGAYIRLLSSVSASLIVNPNGCNASDFYAGVENTVYVEGSTIDRFLYGEIRLKECRTHNKILCAVNKPVSPANINAVNASRWMLGADIEIVELNTPLKMEAFIGADGLPSGKIEGADEMIDQIRYLEYDQLCVHSYISCPEEVAASYWSGTLYENPWGKVEQLLSSYVSRKLNKQCFHAPCESTFNTYYDSMIVRLQQAPEILSNTYANCIFSGAHKAPTIIHPTLSSLPTSLSVSDISFLVSPMCWSTPHNLCLKNNIPIIMVRENTSKSMERINPTNDKRVVYVSSYLEAVGYIQCLNEGICYETIRLD